MWLVKFPAMGTGGRSGLALTIGRVRELLSGNPAALCLQRLRGNGCLEWKMEKTGMNLMMNMETKIAHASCIMHCLMRDVIKRLDLCVRNRNEEKD